MQARRISLCLALFTVAALASPAPDSPAFARLKTLVGDWEGTYSGGGSSKVNFRVGSGGSALLLTSDAGGADEMLTVFHPDGDRLLATHYCSATTHPRMKLVPGAGPDQLAFEFVDATNLPSPEAGHMRRLVITFIDADHHRQTWTFREKGKDETGVFEFSRKKR
jgi:hypothetical protein